MTILCKRDDELVPVFYRALADTDQLHVARMLGYEGLYMHLMCYLFSTCSRPFLCLRAGAEDIL